jgi:uncharacterized protein YodC (DUF2158 family)
MVTLQNFLADPQGARFKDVIENYPSYFDEALAFFNDEDRLKRMEDSETHHDRPAFAGVVKEFEANPQMNELFTTVDAHKTTRFRQAIGTLIRIHMTQRGWHTTGDKGSLGTRNTLKEPSSDPGAYYNKTGISKWFTKSERYRNGRFFINDVVQLASGGPPLIIIPTPETRPAGFPDGVRCAPYKGDRSDWSWYHALNLVLVPKEQIDSTQ